MKTSWKIILALFLIFICGIVIGTGGTLIIERAIIKRSIENPQRAKLMLVHRFARQYNLTKEQKESIAMIIADEASKLAEIRMSVAPEVESVLNDAQKRIGAELDESQRQKFERGFDKWLERFRRIYYAGTGTMSESDK